MDTLKNIEAVVETNVKNVLSNPYIMVMLKVSLVLYASQIAPQVPHTVSDIFHNTFFKIVVISLVIYLADIDFQLAIIIAVIYVLSINAISGRGLFESYENVMPIETQGTFELDISKITNLLGKPVPPPFGTLIESHSDNYPGCENVKLADLLSMFDGDYNKLQQTVNYSYKMLMEQLPQDLPAKDKLIKMAHAVGLPYNVSITDREAPLIASFLINAGYMVTDSCKVPQ